MSNVQILATEAEYDAALARAWVLMDAEPGSPELEELKVLVDLIETYEEMEL